MSSKAKKLRDLCGDCTLKDTCIVNPEHKVSACDLRTKKPIKHVEWHMPRTRYPE